MTDRTVIFHLSDIHFGLADDRALDWVKQEIAEKRPAAVAITGDLTMRARHREFAAATHWINSLDVPVTVEVGNHDMPYFNLIERSSCLAWRSSLSRQCAAGSRVGHGRTAG